MKIQKHSDGNFQVMVGESEGVTLSVIRNGGGFTHLILSRGDDLVAFPVGDLTDLSKLGDDIATFVHFCNTKGTYEERKGALNRFYRERDREQDRLVALLGFMQDESLASRERLGLG